MHCSASPERIRARAYPLMWLAACSVLLAVTEPSVSAPPKEKAGFDIRHARTRLVEDVYLLDADIDFDFSDQALEAMENGVPITIILEMDIRRHRRHMWDENVARLEARYRIETLPLSKTYVIENLNSGQTRAYPSFEDMVVGLGTIRSFPLIDEHLVQADERYFLHTRVRLDIESLPAPLRPLAYLSSVWRLKSDWQTWPVEP